MARFKFEVEKDRCKGCGLCVSVCPKGILRMSDQINAMGYHFPEIVDQNACIGCKMCATMCPDVAIRLYRVEEGEHEKTA